jgi:hypothetical protein
MEEKSGHFGRISPRKRNAARELADPHAILHFTRLGPQYQSLRPQITIAHGFTVGCRSGQVGLYSGIGGGFLQVPVSAPSCSVQGRTAAVRREIRPGCRMASGPAPRHRQAWLDEPSKSGRLSAPEPCRGRRLGEAFLPTPARPRPHGPEQQLRSPLASCGSRRLCATPLNCDVKLKYFLNRST